jgi:cathepsin A (carboxypeptidase C)
MAKILCLLICALEFIAFTSATHFHEVNKEAVHDDIFLGEDQEAGLISLHDGELFYWLFRSRQNKTNDPLVFWLTGGPGCASEIAVFEENGPYKIKNDLTLVRNKLSWNEISNMVYVDQPVGTGFSSASTFVHDENQIAVDFYVFLMGFLKKYPEFEQRPIYITGESYAGHYIPAIAAYIHRQMDKRVNLVAVAIGNGLVDPYNQYPAYADYALENHLINQTQYALLKVGFVACDALIKSGMWAAALEVCNLEMMTIVGNPVQPSFNLYDIRKECSHPPLCYDFSHVDAFLRQPEVIKALGVQGRAWTECNMQVHMHLMGDWMTSLSTDITYLLDNEVFTFVYSGDKDFICNWRGGEDWTNDINWKYQPQFEAAEYLPWGPDGSYGEYKLVEDLAFVRVYDSGHMVPMDQPQAALYMFQKFLVEWKNISRPIHADGTM